jgi:hypothetical protein
VLKSRRDKLNHLTLFRVAGGRHGWLFNADGSQGRHMKYDVGCEVCCRLNVDECKKSKAGADSGLERKCFYRILKRSE